MQNKSRLKIWVCEYVSAGGLASESLPASLLQEGLLMRNALLGDLAALGIDCITSHDARVMPPEHAASFVIQPGDDAFNVWRNQLADDEIDACWVIAPETDGLLERMYTLVQEVGLLWIGCTADAIRKTSSKSLMADICHAAGISIIPYTYLHQSIPLSALPWYRDAQSGWVVKPDDGAGCESTFYFKSDLEIIEFNKKINKNKLLNYQKLLLQPYVSGQPLSMSVLSTKNQVKVIAGHLQHICIEDGEFRFHGAGVNQAASFLPLMQALAESIHLAIPGLMGYWGVDMILTDEQTLTLVEINPRLTTPYIALSKVLTENPAQMILDAVLRHKMTDSKAASSMSLVLPAAETQLTERQAV